MPSKITERWDLYDHHRNPTGKSHLRGTPLGKDCYHLIVHVCIFNQQNQLLIQQRQADKIGFPNMWDLSAAGSALQGETSQQAAEREVAEELGVNIDLSNQRPRLTVCVSEGFDDYWMLYQEITPDQLTLQISEVQAARWATEAEVLALSEAGKFIPYFFLKELFRLKDGQESTLPEAIE